MSAEAINELFHQIVQSEECIKQRFQHLKRVNQQIQEYQDKIREAVCEAQSLKGQLAAAQNKFVHDDVEHKWLNLRENILLEQKTQASLELSQLAESFTKLEEQGAEKRRLFLMLSKSFIKEFDLVDDDSPAFEKGLEDQLFLLKAEMNALDAEVKTRQEALANTKKLYQRKADIERDLSRHTVEIQDLRTRLAAGTEETDRLLRNKEWVCCRPGSDEEFQRLSTGIEQAQQEANTLSITHQALTTELYRWQQKCMQSQQFYRQSTSCAQPANCAWGESATPPDAAPSSPSKRKRLGSANSEPQSGGKLSKPDSLVDGIFEGLEEDVSFDFQITQSQHFSEALPQKPTNSGELKRSLQTTSSRPKFSYTSLKR